LIQVLYIEEQNGFCFGEKGKWRETTKALKRSDEADPASIISFLFYDSFVNVCFAILKR
jgi:hypothetical protein